MEENTGVQNRILQSVVSSVVLLVLILYVNTTPVLALYSRITPTIRTAKSRGKVLNALGIIPRNHKQYFNMIYLSAPLNFLIY